VVENSTCANPGDNHNFYLCWQQVMLKVVVWIIVYCGVLHFIRLNFETVFLDWPKLSFRIGGLFKSKRENEANIFQALIAVLKFSHYLDCFDERENQLNLFEWDKYIQAKGLAREAN